MEVALGGYVEAAFAAAAGTGRQLFACEPLTVGGCDSTFIRDKHDKRDIFG